MLCEICNKNEASFHIKQTFNNKQIELHLCENCAKDKGFTKGLYPLSFLLSELSENFFSEDINKKKKQPQIKCPNCGMNFTKFNELCQLGCSECYSTFNKQLKPLLRKIHGSVKHSGKSPNKVNNIPINISAPKPDIKELRTKLQNAIRKEEYEEAARLRDLIFNLEKNA